MEQNINKFKVGDKVMLNGNPFDPQLGEFGTPDMQEVIEIKDTSDIKGTSGQWIKTDFYHKDFIDAFWFDIEPILHILKICDNKMTPDDNERLDLYIHELYEKQEKQLKSKFLELLKKEGCNTQRLKQWEDKFKELD